MATAYVLINCELGAEKEVFSQLQSTNRVTDTKGVFGAYDIVTKVEAATVELVRDIIATKIRGIGRIRSTLTLMGSEKEGRS